MELKDWNIAADSNGFSVPDGFPENMNYRDVNNAAREIMAVMARYNSDTNGSLTSGGTASAITLTANGTYLTYTVGLTFVWRAALTSTTASPTIDINSMGAKPITTGFPGYLQAGGLYQTIYDGTEFSATRLDDGGTGLIPTGGTVDYFGTTEPPGWIECNGRILPTDTPYPGLRAFCGERFALASDVAGTSRIPNMLRRFKYGANATDTIGDIGGEALSSLVPGNVPEHVHGAGSYTAALGGAHTHGIRQFGSGEGDDGPRVPDINLGAATPMSGIVVSDGDHTHTLTGDSGTGTDLGSAAGADTFSNEPPYIIVMSLIKT